ncbi:serine arginine repetitive matrix protein hypothetical protein [Limosa lapponica baueri]|uniref:Uncharacterized protein n=1 Tax=Limosa lapponica baueri TaxID=1758121 RepID=A0A2I0TI12_LIMLA|nr:serine arginine repetitive matrix protein hypothetical protein [Limosa lapponica baueri]
MKTDLSALDVPEVGMTANGGEQPIPSCDEERTPPPPRGKKKKKKSSRKKRRRLSSKKRRHRSKDSQEKRSLVHDGFGHAFSSGKPKLANSDNSSDSGNSFTSCFSQTKGTALENLSPDAQGQDRRDQSQFSHSFNDCPNICSQRLPVLVSQLFRGEEANLPPVPNPQLAAKAMLPQRVVHQHRQILPWLQPLQPLPFLAPQGLSQVLPKQVLLFGKEVFVTFPQLFLQILQKKSWKQEFKDSSEPQLLPLQP